MSDKELEEVALRVTNISQGIWTPLIEGKDFASGSSFIMVRHGEKRGEDIEVMGATDADIVFIANAKQDIPRLLDEIKRLKAMLNEFDAGSVQ